jgi:HrpA-like RNA helicase
LFTYLLAATEARRISAISIADRVSQEQCLDDAGSLIGYQVRLESASSKDTQLLFLTPGVLLRKLQSSPQLTEYTHIFIDEIHERDKYTEFLMITLRDLLPVRPDLRLVLMSATLQTEVLLSYFKDFDHSFYKAHPPAIVEIEGRTFPVQDFFLEHVLQMTEYIEPMMPSTSDGDGGGGAMSMEQLERELAKLSAQDVDTSVTCVMCGQSFPDHVALGSHVAVCGGASTTTTSRNGDYSMPVLNEVTHNGGMEGVESGDFEEYEDYDVDGTPQGDVYEFCDAGASKGPMQEDAEPDREKWDGEGLFPAEHVTQNDFTSKEEELLNQYQTMHDDETIDTALLLEILLYINKSSDGEGAILVFLPGWMEISEFTMLLECSAPFHNRSKFLILPLHSGIPSSDQRKVLQRPPTGMRKIVLSTNIAETSLTIDDVAFVVDTGRAKEKDYDPHLKTSTLQPMWISQASAKQRRGRAGRTKAGVCFRLFSSRRYQNMRPFVESELLRTPLVRCVASE